MLELSRLTVVRKQGTGQYIFDMQAPSHGWIAPTTITTNYPMANSQQFLSLYQAKTQVRMDQWMGK
jgi:hypothetical protein